MEIAGRVKKILYEKNYFTIAKVELEEVVKLPSDKLTSTLTIKGNFKTAVNAQISAVGEIEEKLYKNRKTYSLKVSSFTEKKLSTEKDIMQFLESLDGVGPSRAREIYARFGKGVVGVLDNNVEALKICDGISDKLVEKIEQSYITRIKAKVLFDYLQKFNMSYSKIAKILKYSINAETAVYSLKNSPHKFYLTRLIPFAVAEKIAKEEKLDMYSRARIKACIIEALAQNEATGNTYMLWKKLTYSAVKLVNAHMASEKALETAFTIRDILKDENFTDALVMKRISDKENIVYRKNTNEAERELAENIRKQANETVKQLDYLNRIEFSEAKHSLTLSDTQREAIQKALTSSLSVVLGGAGSGKSTLLKILVDVYMQIYPEKNIYLASPTGRAARKMAEKTGLEASTIHHLLNITADDEIENLANINNALVVIDEASMLDIFIANNLFRAINENVQIVFLGDINQLPSVGAGAVLKDLVNSEVCNVTKLDKIFRQSENSAILKNSEKINEKNTNLEYSETFKFIEKNTSSEIADEIKKQYEKAILKYGVDEVVVLTPFRKNTETGANALNILLKQVVNPYPEKTTRENKIGGLQLYKNDKVMFTKNLNELSNGDIGYIDNIEQDGSEQYAVVKFGDKRLMLSGEDLKSLVQAYAITIHKAQGSEYKAVIIALDSAHECLLDRKLVYTAITRASENVIIVGEREALKKSITNEKSSERNTELESLLKKNRRNDNEKRHRRN